MGYKKHCKKQLNKTYGIQKLESQEPEDMIRADTTSTCVSSDSVSSRGSRLAPVRKDSYASLYLGNTVQSWRRRDSAFSGLSDGSMCSSELLVSDSSELTPDKFDSLTST